MEKKPVVKRGITNSRFAAELKKHMKRRNITPVELARRMDEPLPYILEVLKGGRSIQLETLIKFAKVLNVPIMEFSRCIKKDCDEGDG